MNCLLTKSVVQWIYKDFKQDAMLVLCYGLICDTAVHINSSQSEPVTTFEMKKKSFTYSHSQVYVYKGISMVGGMGLCKYFDVSLC